MVTSEFEELAVEHDLMPAAAKAAHLVAVSLLQMLVLQHGGGPWIEETRQALQKHLDGEAVPDGQTDTVRQGWQATQSAMLTNIFQHAELVVDGSQRRH